MLPPVQRRERRGATLVFVALMLIALLGVCAIAVDLSRIYVGVNELQTAVDAAALRGAMALQRAPSGNPTATVTTFMNGSNRVMGASATNVTVQGWHWESDATKQKAVAWGATGATAGVNAVRVTATLSAGMLFGRAISAVIPRPSKSATAWVASVGMGCMRPWMFEVTKVFQRGGVTVAANATPTEAQLADLRNSALSTRVNLMIAPPTESSPDDDEFGSALAGKWVGVDLPTQTFESAMNNCNAAALSYPVVLENAAGSTKDNKKVVERAEKNIEYKSPSNPQICPLFNGLDDRCNVLMPIMLGYATSGSFAQADKDHSARLMTTFRLLCFKRSDRENKDDDDDDDDDGKKSKKQKTFCSEAPNDVDWEDDIPVGTMYGYLDYSLPSFGGQFTLGTTGSTAQRLILVR
jgi:Flp pilus assembly protein TadG